MNPTEQHSRRLLLSGLPPKPHAENTERTIDVYVTIIVMAMLISSLLISMFKCLCGSAFNNQPPPQPQDGDATITSSLRDELATFPTFIYSELLSASCSSNSTSSSLGLETNCAICLEEFFHGEEVRVLPRCRHMYHRGCIDQWLLLRSLHCPICRDRTIEQDVEPTRTHCTVVDVGDPSMLLGPSFANNLQ